MSSETSLLGYEVMHEIRTHCVRPKKDYLRLQQQQPKKPKYQTLSLLKPLLPPNFSSFPFSIIPHDAMDGATEGPLNRLRNKSARNQRWLSAKQISHSAGRFLSWYKSAGDIYSWQRLISWYIIFWRFWSHIYSVLGSISAWFWAKSGCLPCLT
jgi:hypothetical protein